MCQVFAENGEEIGFWLCERYTLRKYRLDGIKSARKTQRNVMRLYHYKGWDEGVFGGLTRIMRDIVEKLCRVEAELKKRKDGDRLAQYNTGEVKHEKQLAFHRCLKRNRWVFGGNRSGKTECGAGECVYLARGIHPYKENKTDVQGWVVSLSTQVQRDVAQKKILQYLRRDWIEDIVMQSGRKDSPEHGIIDFIRVKNVLGGSSMIGFKSCDQGREKFQGTSLDFVWFDEEPPEDVYDECRMRVIDRKGELFGTMTPLKGLTFVYNEIFLNRHNDPEVWYEFMEWSDNPYLDRAEVERMEGSMDENTLQECVRLVQEEFSMVLGIAVHEVGPYIQERL